MACYQLGHSSHYHDFKLATSTFVPSILDVYVYSHIPQALRFYYILCSFGNLILFGSYAMLMRPKKAKTAVHGCQHSNSLFFVVVLRVKVRYQCGNNAHHRGFKLATNTFVLSILDVDLYSHIPQELHVYCTFNMGELYLSSIFRHHHFPPHHQYHIISIDGIFFCCCYDRNPYSYSSYTYVYLFYFFYSLCLCA